MAHQYAQKRVPDPVYMPEPEPFEPDHQEQGYSDGWSIPWSDLMMVMFVLFAVLYAYSAAERDVRETLQEPEEAVLREPGDVFEQGRAAIHRTALENVEVSLLGDRSVLISLPGPLLFDLGKADLRPETFPVLDQVAGVIGRTPYEVHVIGHTDPFPISTPQYPTNWELSAARASRVTRHLIDSADLDPARFTVIGHALYRPAVPNDSPANKARNRRVEIVITRAELPGTAEDPS
jgi:chemotaxis protein MotB